MKNFGGWYWFLSGNEKLLDENKCGKWMHFFSDQDFAIGICEKAISEGICCKCKCTNMEERMSESGVICFYLNADDVKNHHKVIKFMIENDLIQKTKSGKLYNISFKLDSQTRAGQYGADFEGKIKLDSFVNLQTGEWLRD